MDNTKEIKFRAVIDNTGFDQQMRSLQDKISQITRQSGVGQAAQAAFGQGTGMGKLTQSFFGSHNQSSVGELREQFNLNVRQMQHQSREMTIKEREMGKLAKLEDSMTIAQRDRVKLLQEEIKAIKEKGRVLIEENTKIAQTAQGLGVSDLSQAGFKGTGTAPVAQPQQGFFGRMRGLASNVMAQMGGGAVFASRVAGAGLAGASMYANYLDYQMPRDRQMAANLARTVQGANIGLESTMQGRGYMNFYENEERQAALQMAMQERDIKLTRDPLRAGLGATGSAIKYGAMGAAAGSFLPGLGTAVGGALGGLYGAAKGAFAGGPQSAFAQIFDRDAYMSSVNAGTLDNFRSNLAAARMADPEKFAAAGLFDKRSGGLQALQRQLGVGDEFLMGTAGQEDGFLQRSMRERGGGYAFSEDRIRQNLNQILQAGGTSDFVTGQMGATLSAEYQRGGLTNAARELGGISATGNMGAERTEEQYKKFIAEAMRIGLDSSEFAKESTVANEEVRRVMSAISDVYTRSGGAEGAVDVFAQGLMGGAGMEIRGAQTAFGVRSQESGQGTGYRGALKYAFMGTKEGQELFGGLPEYLKNAFASYNLENLDEDDPLIREAAARLGVEPSEMVQRIRKLQASGENYSAQADMSRQALQEGYVGFLQETGQKDTAEARKQFTREEGGRGLLADFIGYAGQERGDQFLQMSTQAKQSYAFGGITVPEELRGVSPDIDTTARGAFDQKEASTAADQATQIEVLNRNLGKLAESAESNAKESIEIRVNTFNTSTSIKELLDFLKEGGQDTSGAIMNKLQNMLDQQTLPSNRQPNMGNRKVE